MRLVSIKNDVLYPRILWKYNLWSKDTEVKSWKLLKGLNGTSQHVKYTVVWKKMWWSSLVMICRSLFHFHGTKWTRVAMHVRILVPISHRFQTQGDNITGQSKPGNNITMLGSLLYCRSLTDVSSWFGATINYANICHKKRKEKNLNHYRD